MEFILAITTKKMIIRLENGYFYILFVLKQNKQKFQDKDGLY